MVKTINKSVCRGVAGKRNGKVKGVVIHNTFDNLTATQHMNRLGNMTNKQLEAGFAHYFIDESTIVRTEDTYNAAWHTANADGNANYIGYEVCRSTGSQANFLQAEQNTFKQVAEDLKFYGLPANRNTVRLHREFVPTSCPHRSWDLHGKSVDTVKDYFIKEINKYMKGGNVVSEKDDRTPHYVVVGWFTQGASSLKTLETWLKNEKMGYSIKKKGNKIWLSVGYFPQSSDWKRKLERYLDDKRWSYVVCYKQNIDDIINKW